ncbi:hypothetical protein HGB24_02340, partial [Candidatus Saccharibacteria bacterium]|nr:hypothetical protein [Candidatus Saccharibacteria bacterium]
TALSGGLSPSLSEAQQIYAGLIFIMGWLTIIWLLRNLIAGNKVRVRDGLYNSGSPILPTIMVTILMIFQALPLAIAIIAYGAAVSTGLLNGGVEAMLFWIFAALMAFLSIYWLTSTFFALIIVTLPGMYPYRAIRLASDLVIGRRLRIIYRLLWMIFILALVWAVVAIPIILLDEWLKGLWPAIKWLPVVPVVLLILNVFSVIWGSTYIYLLYRKVVDDESNADTKQA